MTDPRSSVLSVADSRGTDLTTHQIDTKPDGRGEIGRVDEDWHSHHAGAGGDGPPCAATEPPGSRRIEPVWRRAAIAQAGDEIACLEDRGQDRGERPHVPEIAKEQQLGKT